jgi:hypothetical protein
MTKVVPGKQSLWEKAVGVSWFEEACAFAVESAKFYAQYMS